MRDRGLSEAIRAAGGVSELARLVGISQPSVSNWIRVPAERVAVVETVTGVDRAVLRPDLYGDIKTPASEITRIAGLAGWSGSGKTTLVTKLIPVLNARGLRISTLKHAHHGFDLDTPGKDSFMHRAAGATEVIISSAKRWAVLHELRDEAEWDMRALIAKMSPVDLVLVEGFKREPFPKLEVYRSANGKPLLHPDDPHIVAVACDGPLPESKVPVIDLNDVGGVADWLLDHSALLSDTDIIRRS